MNVRLILCGELGENIRAQAASTLILKYLNICLHTLLSSLCEMNGEKKNREMELVSLVVLY